MKRYWTSNLSDSLDRTPGLVSTWGVHPYILKIFGTFLGKKPKMAQKIDLFPIMVMLLYIAGNHF